MTVSGSNPNNSQSGWAKPVDKLKVGDAPHEAVNLNVDGRRLSGLTHGFGQLWQKTYQVRLSGVKITPQQVIKSWKENFPKFWPQGNNIYVPLTGIQPGEVGLINLSERNKLITGKEIEVIDRDTEFKVMIPLIKSIHEGIDH